MPRHPNVQRFWEKIDQPQGPEGCWLWTGTRDQAGYGQIRYDKRLYKAHRFGYELVIGPIPPDMTLDHLCGNQSCVNPAHLEPVTLAVNILRGNGPSAQNARRTHCGRGHEFTPANTRIDKRGKRLCRACNRENCRAFHLSRRLGL